MKKFLTIFALAGIFSCDFSEEKNNPSHFHFHKGSPMQFVDGSQDIPLAKGLTKISNDEDLGFDSVGGSIISASYLNKKPKSEIRDFYLKTLPQLGWKAIKPSRYNSLETLDFVRDKEKLEIEFATQNNAQMVKFFVESSAK